MSQHVVEVKPSNSFEAVNCGSFYAGAPYLAEHPTFRPQSHSMPQQPSGFQNVHAQASQVQDFQSQPSQPMSSQHMGSLGQPSALNPFQYQPMPKQSNGFSSGGLQFNNAQVPHQPSCTDPSQPQQQLAGSFGEESVANHAHFHSRLGAASLETMFVFAWMFIKPA